MHAQGRGIDQVSVAGEFPLGDVQTLVHALAEMVPSTANVGEYITLVRQAAQSRRYHQIAEEALRVLAESNGDGPRHFLEVISRAREDARVPHRRQGGTDLLGCLLGAGHDEAQWVFPDVLARGRGHAIYAKHKTGKTWFTLSMAATLAMGPAPVACVYLDYEMGGRPISASGSRTWASGPESDLSRLCYALWPVLPPLTHPREPMPWYGWWTGSRSAGRAITSWS